MRADEAHPISSASVNSRYLPFLFQKKNRQNGITEYNLVCADQKYGSMTWMIRQFDFEEQRNAIHHNENERGRTAKFGERLFLPTNSAIGNYGRYCAIPFSEIRGRFEFHLKACLPNLLYHV